jgi:hypothetical protein
MLEVLKMEIFLKEKGFLLKISLIKGRKKIEKMLKKILIKFSFNLDYLFFFFYNFFYLKN